MGSISWAEFQRRGFRVESRILIKIFRVIQIDSAQYDGSVLHADRQRDQRTQRGCLLENQIETIGGIKQSFRPKITQPVGKLSLSASGHWKGMQRVPRSRQLLRSREALGRKCATEFRHNLHDVVVILCPLLRDSTKSREHVMRMIGCDRLQEIHRRNKRMNRPVIESNRVVLRDHLPARRRNLINGRTACENEQGITAFKGGKIKIDERTNSHLAAAVFVSPQLADQIFQVIGSEKK